MYTVGPNYQRTVLPTIIKICNYIITLSAFAYAWRMSFFPFYFYLLCSKYRKNIYIR